MVGKLQQTGVSASSFGSCLQSLSDSVCLHVCVCVCVCVCVGPTWENFLSNQLCMCRVLRHCPSDTHDDSNVIPFTDLDYTSFEPE